MILSLEALKMILGFFFYFLFLGFNEAKETYIYLTTMEYLHQTQNILF